MGKILPKFRKNQWDDEQQGKKFESRKKGRRGDAAEQKRMQREFEAENMVFGQKD